MGSKKLLQKSILIGLIVSGLIFILFALLPEFSGSGEKEFGYIQLFFIRNGFFLLLIGLILSLFPKAIDYLKQTFSDNEYAEERPRYQNIISLSKYDFIILILFLVAANLFTIYFIGKENTIYTWDASHFWGKFIAITNKFKASPVDAIKAVLVSLQYGEYNFLGPFLLIPFPLLFGTERLSYILSIVNIFGFLSALFFLLLFKRFSIIMHHHNPPYITTLIPLFTFFACPFIWIPILFGYVGPGGFFIMCLILIFYFRLPLIAQRYGTLMAIGILLSILPLFRRWYSFWAVSFMITLFINEMIFLYIDHKFDRNRLIVILKKIAFTIFTAGISYILIAGPRLIEVITKDYSYLIAVYNPYTLSEHFIGFLNRFGLIYITLTLLGFFISLSFKDTRKFALFLLIQWIITFVLFTRMSYFSFQHYYILLPTILLFVSLSITELVLKAKYKTIKIAIITICISTSAIVFSTTFIPGASLYSYKNKLFPRLRYYPSVRNDINEIKRMIKTLGKILKDSNDRVYVLAGSDLLNSEHFLNAGMSLREIPEIKSHILITSTLDLRDGFPHNLFKAEYVIVTNPIQCDLGCKKQRVISIPAEWILKGENIGISYERLPYEFILGPDGRKRNVKAYIYKRVNPDVQADIKFLSDALRKYYPDNPFVYESHLE